MPKKKDVIDKTEELIDEVEDLIEEVKVFDFIEEAKKRSEIVVPQNIVEALLAAKDSGDRVAFSNIVQQIRELAEDQAPAVFRTHRHDR